MKKQLAAAVALAADLREASWVKEPDVVHNSIAFSQGHYTVSVPVAATEAVKQLGMEPEMAEILMFLLATAWNDTLEWAERNK